MPCQGLADDSLYWVCASASAQPAAYACASGQEAHTECIHASTVSLGAKLVHGLHGHTLLGRLQRQALGGRLQRARCQAPSANLPQNLPHTMAHRLSQHFFNASTRMSTLRGALKL